MRYLLDAHCHLHEFDDYEIQSFEMLADKVAIVAVSDDAKSSKRTLELARKFRHVIPCVGIHPWSVHEAGKEDVNEVEKLAGEPDVLCIGEVGLDKKFVPHTFQKQVEVFSKMLSLAKEYGLVVNVHAPDAWRDVLDMLLKYDIDKAIIHWYTGPLNLLEEIVSVGYFITVNPAVKIQRKHVRAVSNAPLTNLLPESDGPYVYRGLRLEPKMVREVIREVAKIKGVSEAAVESAFTTNLRRLFPII